MPYNGEEYLVGPENQVLAVIESEVDLNEVVASTELTEEDKSNLTQIS